MCSGIRDRDLQANDHEAELGEGGQGLAIGMACDRGDLDRAVHRLPADHARVDGDLFVLHAVPPEERLPHHCSVGMGDDSRRGHGESVPAADRPSLLAGGEIEEFSVAGLHVSDVNGLVLPDVAALRQIGVARKTLVVAIDAHRDCAVGVRRLDHEGCLRVVADLHIGVGEAEGGFPALGVAGEVQRMRPVLDVLVASEEPSVVHRGGELADPASDVCRVPLADDGAGDDGAVFQITLFLGASAGELVDREHLIGEGDRVVDGVGDEMDVVHPVCTGSVGRELAHQV